MPPPGRLARLVLRISVAAALLVAAAYAVDSLALHLRFFDQQARLGTVRVRRYYAVRLKNRSTSYMFDEPRDETCVHSIFPHFGDPPCWYAARHTEERIDINAGPPAPLINTP
jgi:hypothetical protein